MALEMEKTIEVADDLVCQTLIHFLVRDDVLRSLCVSCKQDDGALIFAVVLEVYLDGIPMHLESDIARSVNEIIYRRGWTWQHVCQSCYDTVMGLIYQGERLK